QPRGADQIARGGGQRALLPHQPRARVALLEPLLHRQLMSGQHRKKKRLDHRPSGLYLLEVGFQLAAFLYGSRTVKEVPRPGALSTSIRPPCEVTMPCATAKPSPVPCPAPRVVKNG